MTLPETNPSSTEPIEIPGSGAIMWPGGIWVMGSLLHIPGRTFGPGQEVEARAHRLSVNEATSMWADIVDSPAAE